MALLDVPAQAWRQWRRQRAEKRMWADAHDFPALRELTARWCLGELSWSAVGQPAPRDPETEYIGDALAAINRAGLLTTHSQPANEFHDRTVQQRAFVEGYATPEVEEQLRRLIAGTRLRMVAHIDRGWCRGHGGDASSRQRNPDGTWCESGSLGPQPAASQDGLELHGLSGDLFAEVADLPFISIWDPQWRPSDLLWRRLSVPDWNRPPPLAEEDRAPADAVPTDQEVDRLSSATDAAFEERDRLLEAGDEAAADEYELLADYLHTLYSAACHAQYDEVERRRMRNLTRYSRDEAAADGDLRTALRLDDMLEDAGMPGDQRLTCYDCQTWADHTHNPAAGKRLPDPALVKAAREWLSECFFLDVDPEDFDDHEFITDDEVLRAADRAYDGGLDALARDLVVEWPPAPPAVVSTQPGSEEQ